MISDINTIVVNHEKKVCKLGITEAFELFSNLTGMTTQITAFVLAATPLTYPIGIVAKRWIRRRKLLKYNPTKFSDNIESFIEEIESPAWKCINKYKTSIAKDMSIIKLNTSKKMVLRWCKENLKVKNTIDLKDSLTELLTNICKTYVDQWKMSGIDPIIINSTINSHQGYLQNVITECVAEISRDYNNTSLTMNHIMNICFIHLKMSVNSLRILMDNFNGLLKDKEYKGIKNTNEYIPISKLTTMSAIFSEDETESK